VVQYGIRIINENHRAKGDAMKEIKVWDIQTRVFHWSLVLFTLCTLVTADILKFLGIDLVNKDTWLTFHIGTGVAVGILLLFRVFWGLSGPYYSRFSSLHLSLSELASYFKAVIKNVKTHYTGHNPAASWGTLGIITLGLLAVLTGAVVFGLDEGRGILRSLYLGYYPYADLSKLLHHALAYFLLAIILGHVCGVLNETIRHRTGIIPAMFTGKKFSEEDEKHIDASAPLRVVSYLWVLSPLGAILYLSGSMETKRPVKLPTPAIYIKECGACHMAFPPNTLPAVSWKGMMANLKNHFGEDATIDDAAKKEIEDFLVRNAAETSHEEASLKFIRSIGTGNPPAGISDIPYWKEKHQSIAKAIYQRSSIKSRINCVACHKLAEYGSFEDNDIRIPK
jgi:cytochrome b